MDRVYLFAPGDSRKKLEKALVCGVDVVVIDLEDGVGIDHKEQARTIVARTLSELSGRQDLGVRVVLRVNAVADPHFPADMELLRTVTIDGLMIPKCESAAELQKVNEVVPGLEIIPLLESVRGIQRLEQMVQACRNVHKVAFGAVDFASDLGVPWSAEGEERRFAMGQLVFSSRAAGLEPPIDAVFPLIHDDQGFIRDALAGKRMGFSGKMIIHPKQIVELRRVYQVSEEELAWSMRVVESYEQANGEGSIQLDGRLIDRPIYDQAKRIVSDAERQGMNLSQDQ